MTQFDTRYNKILGESFELAVKNKKLESKEYKLTKENYYYKQALEKISEIAKSFNNEGLCFYDDIEDCVNCDMRTDCNYLRKIELINIINKAKDGE